MATAGLAHATGTATLGSVGGTLPAVVTSAASSVTGTSAILNGTVNPEGLSAAYQFQYGLTTAYGSLAPAFMQSAGSGTTAVAYGFALSGLAPSTTYHYRIAASSSAGTSYGSDQQFTTTSAAGGVTFPGRPPNPLGLKVELQLAGTWQNITAYVLQRDLLQITSMGRTDEATSIQSGQLALTLKNTDGRFTPNNAAGAYYPNIVLNAQIRVSVNATSATSANYNGYRFYGEISNWPPTSNPVAAGDIYIQVVASGIWRRVSNMSVTIGSAYTRYIGLLSGVNVPAAAWAMEDGSGSTGFVLTAGSGTNLISPTAPDYASDSADFPGSDSLPQFNGAVISGTVSSGASYTDNVTRYALSVPAGGDPNAGSSGWCISETDSTGTVAKLQVYLNANGTLSLEGNSSGGTLQFTGTTTVSVDGIPVLVSAELTPSGGNVAWALSVIKPGSGAVLNRVTGTISGSVGAVTKVLLNRAGVLSSTVLGQLGVFYSVPSLVTAAAALSGWNGEYAVPRFQRLCAEFFIPAEVIGSTSAQMGPQVDDTLPNLLQVIENTDGGLLYETQDQFGLGYRTLISLQNQSAAAVINYAAGQLGAQLTPTYDDQLLVNQWTVSNWDGYTVLATMISGARSVQPVPEGVGLYSGGPLNVSAYTDTQANTIAQQRLLLGTVNDLRYPTVAVNFLRAQAGSLFTTVPPLRTGDYLQVTNLPSFFGGGTANQLIWGWTETLSAVTWTITFNTVPEIPFTSGYNPGVITVVQQPSGSISSGSQGGSTTAANAAALSAQISALAAQAASGTLTARSIGGVTSFIAAATPYDWSFAVTGSPPPADNTSFTCTAAQAVPISTGDTFTNSGGFGGPFTVTALAPPANGNVSVYFQPAASSVMSSGTVYGGKNGDTWVNTSDDNQIEQWQAGQWQAVQFGPNALSFTAGGATVTIAATAPGSPAAGDIWYDSAAGYVMNQWNGSAWVPYQYGSGAISATARQLGGIITTVAASAPGGALAGDLWINTSAGNAIYQYSGSSWVLYQFGSGSVANNSIAAAQIVANTITAAQIAAGTITAAQIAASTITAAQIAAGTITASLIASGTITATQIAAGTITASQISAQTITAAEIASQTITASQIAAGTILASNLTAGIVVAGIVDATVVQAAEYIASGSAGQFLAYSGTPGSGNLNASISGYAGTDGYSNSYAEGVEIKAGGLILDNQASYPPAVSGASVFFSSVAGRPFYRSQAGDVSSLERSQVNVATYNVGNTTTPSVISASMTYEAAEGAQSSEYEIEIWGAGSWGTSFVNGLTWQLYVDGSAFGNSWTTGIAGQTTGQGFGYKVNFGISILTSGSSGTVLQWSFGNLWRNDPANTDIPSVSLNGGSIYSGTAFDTTSSHTLQVYVNWTATAGGQTLTTYRSKLDRRM